MSFGPRRSTMSWTKRCCTIYPPATRVKHEKVWLHFSKNAVPSGSPVNATRISRPASRRDGLIIAQPWPAESRTVLHPTSAPAIIAFSARKNGVHETGQSIARYLWLLSESVQPLSAPSQIPSHPFPHFFPELPMPSTRVAAVCPIRLSEHRGKHLRRRSARPSQRTGLACPFLSSSSELSGVEWSTQSRASGVNC
jgi:hypothetical protein